MRRAALLNLNYCFARFVFCLFVFFLEQARRWGKTCKQHRTYHINLLSKWQSRDEMAALVMEESPKIPLPHENNVLPFGHEETWEDVMISDDLTEGQRSQVRNLLHEYSDVLSGKPNLTNVATHKINTGGSLPIRTIPYRIPQDSKRRSTKRLRKC